MEKESRGRNKGDKGGKNGKCGWGVRKINSRTRGSGQKSNNGKNGGYLWGRAEVCEVVRRKCGIEAAVRTTGDYLAKWNFTAQRPKKKITVKTQKH
jgi:hypothetical protein